ncbi:MFS transporter [Beauveria brongniartii RCEF 3172]|uniref:MFS transporter n=1 Tax=Beauveria brongniartii RCEF 3172 TaxID=1081107 RepID=A0A162JRR7_9HYPO|nr:MFS transporter [Beauveria brongniartii RCEF 3172]
MSQTEPLSQAGGPTQNLSEPLQVTMAVDEAPTMEGRSNLRVSLVMMALARLAIKLVLFCSALDNSIVSTVLPTISSDLRSAGGYVWVGSAYTLGHAAASTVWANLSDIWGRKPVLLSALALFFASSVVCAAAVSMPVLIAGRAVQGTAGGGMVQMVNIIISDIFSVRRRSLFLGLLEIVWTVAGTVGPILGGALTQSLSWRWIFWINLPLTGFAFLVLVFFLDVHNPGTSTMVGVKAIDWGGTVCVLGIALMLLIGLNFGGVTFAWNSAQVICLLVFGIVTVPLFIYCEARFARMPLMPLDVFRNAHNSAVFVIDFCHSAVVTGGGWFLPLYFQATQLASPLHSGVLFLPIVISSSLMSGAVGFLIHKTGRYVEIIRLGNILVALGIGLFTNFDSSSSLVKIIAYQLILGFGMGMLFFPPLLALHANVSGGQTAAATATFGFIRSMSASVAIVLGGVLFQNGMNVQQSRLVAAGLPSNITDSFKGSDAGANVLLVATIQNQKYQRAVQDAFSDSIRHIWYLYTALGVVGVVSCVFVKTHVMSEVHTEIKTGLDGDRAQEHKR